MLALFQEFSLLLPTLILDCLLSSIKGNICPISEEAVAEPSLPQTAWF